MISRSAVLAGFMYEHPDVCVYDYRANCFFYFSSDDNNFYYIEDSFMDDAFLYSDVKRNPKRAYGLDSALIQYNKWRGV